MSIFRSFKLKTSLSDRDLITAFGNIAEMNESDQTTYIAGTNSSIGVYPLSVQYDWEYSFGVEHNTMVSVRIDNETSPETMRLLDAVIGPFIKAVGGQGWIQHLDIPIVHWNEDVIRIDPSWSGANQVVHSLEAAGLDYQSADLGSEYDAED